MQIHANTVELSKWGIAQSAEIRWWRRYLKNKDSAVYLKWKKEYWINFLAQHGIRITDTSKVLDAGCGPAGIFLITEPSRTLALDPLLDQYSKHLEIFDSKNYPHTEFKTISLEKWKVSQAFDFLFAINSINHVQDLNLVLQNLYRALKPGGIGIITTDAHNHKFLRSLFRILPGDILHPQQYAASSYRKMLLDVGFQIKSEKVLSEAFIFNYISFIVSKAS